MCIIWLVGDAYHSSVISFHHDGTVEGLLLLCNLSVCSGTEESVGTGFFCNWFCLQALAPEPEKLQLQLANLRPNSPRPLSLSSPQTTETNAAISLIYCLTPSTGCRSIQVHRKFKSDICVYVTSFVKQQLLFILYLTVCDKYYHNYLCRGAHNQQLQ